MVEFGGEDLVESGFVLGVDGDEFLAGVHVEVLLDVHARLVAGGVEGEMGQR